MNGNGFVSVLWTVRTSASAGIAMITRTPAKKARSMTRFLLFGRRLLRLAARRRPRHPPRKL
jgi:hypothetical protein